MGVFGRIGGDDMVPWPMKGTTPSEARGAGAHTVRPAFIPPPEQRRLGPQRLRERKSSPAVPDPRAPRPALTRARFLVEAAAARFRAGPRHSRRAARCRRATRAGAPPLVLSGHAASLTPY
jgi:hypothetical protein